MNKTAGNSMVVRLAPGEYAPQDVSNPPKIDEVPFMKGNCTAGSRMICARQVLGGWRKAVVA